MERLLTMDVEQFIARMQQDVQRAMKEIAEAVNHAPQGKVISGAEVRVRELMAELRQKAFQLAVQMRIDSTESSFFPSPGRAGEKQGKQGLRALVGGERQ